MRVKYKGNADVRAFSDNDFKNAGVTSGPLEFSRYNNFTEEVEEEVGKYLVSTGEFRKLRPKSKSDEGEQEEGS